MTGHVTDPENFFFFPAWIILGLASVVELFYWILTFGIKRSTIFTRSNMIFTCKEHTYSIEKARHAFDYEPVNDREEQMRKAVGWNGVKAEQKRRAGHPFVGI